MNLPLEENVPLAHFTTIGVGGPARYFVRTTSVDDLRAAVDWAARRQQPLFILGGGSNLLIADSGFPGLVVKLDLRGVTLESEDEFATVKVAAGERWDDFVALAVERGWAGVECLSGIPGSAGATPIQNVGAYGQEVSETIIRVEVLDRRDGLVKTLTNWECRFALSLQPLQEFRARSLRGRERHLPPPARRRGRRPLSRAAGVRGDHGIEATDLEGVRDAVLAIRRRKGMVLDPADPDTRSDGSFFMNPLLPRTEFEQFLSRLRSTTAEGTAVPNFPAGDAVKLSAAWLIEHAGFQKGYVHGRAGLSTKHTLAVINRGGATAAEILELVRTIQEKVRDTFGIELQPEPNLIGF